MLLTEAIGRAVVGISSLVELGHRGPVADYEEAAPAAGLLLLYDRAGAGAEPLLADVVALLDGLASSGLLLSLHLLIVGPHHCAAPNTPNARR